MTPATKRTNILARGLRDLVDLEGGRRDPAGILARAAALVREVLEVPGAWSASNLETGAHVCVAPAGAGAPRSGPWEGPGSLGREVMEARGALLWTRGEPLAASPLDFQGVAGATAWAGAPLHIGSEVRGLVCALGDDARRLEPADLELLEIVAGHTGTALANCILYQRTEALALTDELTRLYNFRFLKTALRREMERASRYGQDFSIIMIDVDHLKRYNEQHGHLKGSELLRRLAMILSRSSRAIDLVAKYGGDEFMVILPQTRLEGAMTMANRIRAAVAATAFPHCRTGDLTVSVGVAGYPRHGDSPDGLVAAADKALFRAKRKSRNCVVAAETPGSSGEVPEAA